jgi:hypothetical protein
MIRRLIFLRVDGAGGATEPAALFGINLHRSPLFVADVDMHTLVVQEIHDLSADTGVLMGFIHQGWSTSCFEAGPINP